MNQLENWEQLLSIKELMSVHGKEMARRNQSDAQISKPGCIEGALGSAWMAEYLSASETPGAIPGFVFACYALRSLARNHCLVDGNKRLAWVAFALSLAAMGLSVEATDEEAESFVERIIKDHLEGPDVVTWATGKLIVLGAKTVDA